MERRVTVRDLAAKAGVHFTTVARALKGDPQVGTATRERIRLLAEKMGYRPDPVLAAFSAYRKSVKPPSYLGTVAWVTNFPTRSGWRNPATVEYHQGILKKAEDGGYRVEEFWLREPGMTARRASHILQNRGIRGLLLCPQPVQRGHLSIRWELFSVVNIGYSMVRPKMHLVTTSHFRSVVACVRHLRARGFRRIGFCCDYRANERCDRLWSGGFQSELLSLPHSRDIPLFLAPYERAAFLKWYKTHRPQAIVTIRSTNDPVEWLRTAGYSVPGDVGVAVVNLNKDYPGFSGIDECSFAVGSTAMTLLVDLLHRGQRGVPETPLHSLVEGAWVEGKSLSKPVPVKTRRARS